MNMSDNENVPYMEYESRVTLEALQNDHGEDGDRSIRVKQSECDKKAPRLDSMKEHESSSSEALCWWDPCTERSHRTSKKRVITTRGSSWNSLVSEWSLRRPSSKEPCCDVLCEKNTVKLDSTRSPRGLWIT